MKTWHWIAIGVVVAIGIFFFRDIVNFIRKKNPLAYGESPLKDNSGNIVYRFCEPGKKGDQFSGGMYSCYDDNRRGDGSIQRIDYGGFVGIQHHVITYEEFKDAYWKFFPNGTNFNKGEPV